MARTTATTSTATPRRMERPCKWMARARARGYRPRRRLMPVADLDFSNSEKTKIHLPKSLYEPSNGTSMLWVDEEGKFPIPVEALPCLIWSFVRVDSRHAEDDEPEQDLAEETGLLQATAKAQMQEELWCFIKAQCRR
ncbi:unnamed protein product [Effrenium voratum]|nr:unnamed protein product [Effrenium voratum]